MAVIKLSQKWSRVAEAGTGGCVLNIGRTPIKVRSGYGVEYELPHMAHFDFMSGGSNEVFARAADDVAEIVVTLSQVVARFEY